MENARATKKSELRYRRLFEAAQDGILILEAATGKITEVNPFLIKMLGYSHAEFIDKHLWEVGAFQDIQASREAFEALQANKYIRYEDLPLKAKDGRLIQVEFVSNVYRVGRQKVIQCNIRNITERKQAQAALQRLNAELEARIAARTRELRQAQEQLLRQEKLAVLGQMAGSVGHELRNPLGIISNAVYYLKLIQPEAEAKVKEYLGLIESETRNAEKIIGDLLDFARIKSADLLDSEPVALAELVGRTLERYPPPEGVQVKLNFPAALPKVWIDRRQISQVLGNLILNAYQAMTSGGKLTISARQKGAMVAIDLADTGSGVALENMQKLFEPLFTTKDKGIGLGLTISQTLTEANGGNIEFKSRAGQGTTFTVWLPIHLSEASVS
jgi:PAS domain S-box-containing protein